MKDDQLDKEEKQLLEEVERGEWIPVKDQEKAKKEAMIAAKYSLTKLKTKNINLRLSENDILKLKAKAAEAGLPYQTLAASVLHRYANKGKGPIEGF